MRVSFSTACGAGGEHVVIVVIGSIGLHDEGSGSICAPAPAMNGLGIFRAIPCHDRVRAFLEGVVEAEGAWPLASLQFRPVMKVSLTLLKFVRLERWLALRESLNSPIQVICWTEAHRSRPRRVHCPRSGSSDAADVGHHVFLAQLQLCVPGV